MGNNALGSRATKAYSWIRRDPYGIKARSWIKGAFMEQRPGNGFEGALVVNDGAQLWICTLLALSLDNVTNQPLSHPFNTFTQTY